MTKKDVKDFIACLIMLDDYFDSNLDKVATWMIMKNPLLGEVSPFDMFLMGRAKKLKKFIEITIEENER